MKKNLKQNRSSFYYIILGFVLIILVSLIQGFDNSLIGAINHIVNDFTSELLVHMYIAGFILFATGLYLCFRK